ncbi:hypothetical protein [Lentilitoribacter sp. Alg239-R112]|uniref:hypothetical protein n=1 Tax=Lentilitoribacter sp. Alg239-R112 TaxID=2305987 RepID=UPI0013A6BE6C|nr:hypothetical protein [Lentilitoribacter sp. Alg239-R112]
MPSMVQVNCKTCSLPFDARTADVARGWGKFCSKSCKAKEQEKRTGQNKSYLHRKNTRRDIDGDDDDYDLSWDAHKVWTNATQ